MNLFSSPETNRTTILFDGHGDVTPKQEAFLFASQGLDWYAPRGYLLSWRAGRDTRKSNDIRSALEVPHHRLAPMANRLIRSANFFETEVGSSVVLRNKYCVEVAQIPELRYMAHNLMSHLLEDPALIKAQPVPRVLANEPV